MAPLTLYGRGQNGRVRQLVVSGRSVVPFRRAECWVPAMTQSGYSDHLLLVSSSLEDVSNPNAIPRVLMDGRFCAGAGYVLSSTTQNRNNWSSLFYFQAISWKRRRLMLVPSPRDGCNNTLRKAWCVQKGLPQMKHRQSGWRPASHISHPCICVRRPGKPELHYFPKVSILTRGGIVTVDALLCIGSGKDLVWVAVEIDETARPSAESRRREALVPVPTLRLSPDDILKGELIDLLYARIGGYLDRRKAA